MNKKTFKIIQIITAMVLGVTVAVSVNLGNYLLATAAILAAFGFLYVLKSKVKEVLADERDYQIAGKASRMAITIYVVVLTPIGVAMMALSKTHPQFEYTASVLLYSVCGLMLLNAALFKIYNRHGE